MKRSGSAGPGLPRNRCNSFMLAVGLVFTRFVDVDVGGFDVFGGGKHGVETTPFSHSEQQNLYARNCLLYNISISIT